MNESLIYRRPKSPNNLMAQIQYTFMSNITYTTFFNTNDMACYYYWTNITLIYYVPITTSHVNSCENVVSLNLLNFYI